MTGSRTATNAVGSKRRTATGERIPLDEGAILDAAVELFNKQGYHATSISQLAAELKVTKAALYYHVESKADILAKIHQTFMNRAWIAIQDRVKDDSLGDDPVAVLREFVRIAVETVVTHRDYVRVFYQEWGRGADTKENAELTQQRAQYEGLLQSSIERAQKDGTFADAVDAKTAARFFFGAINWTYVWYDPRKSRVKPEQLIDDLLELTLFGLVGRDGKRGLKP